MQFYQRFKPLLFYTFLNLVFLPASVSLHEWGHWFASYCLGYKHGYVIFSPAGGLFHLDEPLHRQLDGFLIGVSGGVTVTIVFAILYFCMDWETDLVEKNVLKSYCVSQFTYALTEGMYGIGAVSMDTLILISNIIYPICLYAYLILTFIQIYHGE